LQNRAIMSASLTLDRGRSLCDLGPKVMERIAHYRLLRQIGSGGMGEVYAADDEHLRRTVALKVLASEMASDPRRLQRFESEARAAASLIHPNIAQVYEAGGDDGTRYIAMELIEGETLEQRIAREELSIPEIVRLGEELAEAVAEAHRQRIIHRDIKSTNVMLTSSGHVKVLDFGLARMEVPAEREDATQWATLPGAVMGTPHSMSPEQALGRRSDERSDIFSIGVVLYEMVTRRMPFRGSTTAETLQKVINAEPEPMARFNYELPIELEKIIRKCLEKQPGRRYQSAGELLVDLRNLRRDLAKRMSLPLARLSGRSRTRKRRVVFGAALAIVLLAILVTWQWQGRREEQLPAIPKVAVFPFTMEGVHEGEEQFADGVTDQVIVALSRFSGLRVMGRSTVFSLEDAAERPHQSARKLRVYAYVTSTIRNDGHSLVTTTDLVRTSDGILIDSERKIRPLSERSLIPRDIAQMVASGLGVANVEQELAEYGTLNSEAYDLYLEGRRRWQQRTEGGLKEAIDLFTRATDLDPDYAAAYAGLADIYSLAERYAATPAAESGARARQAARRAMNLDDRLPEAHVAYASYLETFEWNWREAEDSYRRAIELGPSYSTAHHWNAMLLTRLGRHREAIESIEKARDLDPGNPLVAAAAANVHYYAGNYQSSVEEALGALMLDPSSVLARIQFGLALAFSGEHARAREVLKRVVNDTREVPAIQVQALAAYAVSHAAGGDIAEARQIAEQLENLPGALIADPVEPFMFGYAIAVIYAMLEDRDSAFLWLDRALEVSSFWLSLSGVEPAFDSIRSDPRFDLLLDNVGLPPREAFAGRGTRG
jgi:eukaryotic-like serine/threonine-protein kinase